MKIDFLHSLPQILNLAKKPEHLICGDFNNLINNELDNISGNPHGEKEVAAFNDFVLDNNLTDSWRSLHPFEKDFSWIRTCVGNNDNT